MLTKATMHHVTGDDGTALLHMVVPADFRGTLRALLERERTMHRDSISDPDTLAGDVDAYRTWLLPVDALLDALDDGGELRFPVDGSDNLRDAVREQVFSAVDDERYADAATWLALLAEFRTNP
jgi:hypothetical protein